MVIDLKKKAHELRLDILRMFYLSGTGHMAPALSCVDIFTTLYFGDVISWEKRFSEERDRIVLSKGHACAALYAVLAHAGYFPREELLTFYQRNTRPILHCRALRLLPVRWDMEFALPQEQHSRRRWMGDHIAPMSLWGMVSLRRAQYGKRRPLLRIKDSRI